MPTADNEPDLANLESPVGANRFELASTRKHWQVTYEATATGQRRIHYQDENRDFDVTGPQISSQSADIIGGLLTITWQVVPDFFTIKLTILVPAVNLDDRNDQKAVSTYAIFTTLEHTSVSGPVQVQGQVQHYRVVQLSGTARFVES